MGEFHINNQWVSLSELEEIIQKQIHVVLGPEANKQIEKGYNFLQSKIQDETERFYGINTGFGFLSDKAISRSDLNQLQINLIRSHACGFGAKAPASLVKRMLLLKVIALSKGYSGVQKATIERLLFFYNENILPVVYEQ